MTKSESEKLLSLLNKYDSDYDIGVTSQQETDWETEKLFDNYYIVFKEKNGVKGFAAYHAEHLVHDIKMRLSPAFLVEWIEWRKLQL